MNLAARWTSSAADEFVSKVVENMILTSYSELKKQLPIIDPSQTPLFLEQVKSHYETHDKNPEMTEEKTLHVGNFGDGHFYEN